MQGIAKSAGLILAHIWGNTAKAVVIPRGVRKLVSRRLLLSLILVAALPVQFVLAQGDKDYVKRAGTSGKETAGNSNSSPDNGSGAQDQRDSEIRSDAEGKKSSDNFSLQVLEAQVLLDRELFSPGEIDGVWGNNAKGALNMFQQTRHLKTTDHVDAATSEALMALMPGKAAQGLRSNEQSSFLAWYTITSQDVAGPYFDIPASMAKQATLPEMGYKNITELLGERFHVKPSALERLNPGAKWKAGEEIKVPNVYPTWIESKDAPGMDSASEENRKKSESRGHAKNERGKSADEILSSGLTSKPKGPVTVIVSKADGDLTARDKDGKVIFFAPVTTGSEHDPLPLGEWKINGTERYPGYHYNPELFWDAKKGDTATKIQAGPNNPVGVAWVDLSKPHYGLHGTPEPGKIGYTESHGCVRLTNWDALRLADMVKPGTKVFFINEHQSGADEGKVEGTGAEKVDGQDDETPPKRDARHDARYGTYGRFPERR